MNEKGAKLPKVEILTNGRARVRGVINRGEKQRSFIADTPQKAMEMYLDAKKDGSRVKTEKRPDQKSNRKITLEEAIEKHIQKLSVGGSPSTQRGYDIIKRNAFRELMGRELAKITEDEWQKAIDEETTVLNHAPKTVKNRWDLVKTVMLENKISPPELKLPDAGKSIDDTEDDVKFLDDLQLEVFCKAIRGSKYELACYLALNGLRRSEIYNLEWDKINQATGRIIVFGAVVPDMDNIMVKRDRNKTPRSTRTVPILFPRINELVNNADKSKSIIAYAPSNFYRYINCVCAQNGLPEVGIHGLRHTGASLCIYQGVKWNELLRWFGWANDATPRKIYLHMSNRQRNLEAEKVIQRTTNFSL